MFCAKCGAEIKEGQKFCKQCGAPVPGQEPVQVQGTIPVSAPEPQQKPPEKNTGKILLIVIAVLLAVLIALLVVKVVWLDQPRESGVEDFTEENSTEIMNSAWKLENSEEKKTVNQEDRKLEKRLDEIIEEKGDIRGTRRDMCRSYDLENIEGVVGAVIMDISGDGTNDLVVAYADNNSLYADVYTVENGSAVNKGKRVINLPGFGRVEGCDNFGGIYLKKDSGGWNLVGDDWGLAYMFADGDFHTVQGVRCGKHSYDSLTDYSFAGSSPENSDERQGREAAYDVGITSVDDPLYEPFFVNDTDVVMVCAYHSEISYFGDTMDIVDGECYGDFYIDEVNAHGNRPDSKAAQKLVKKYKKYQRQAQRASEEASLDYEDYILPQSEFRKLTAEDMVDIKNDAWLLKLARNEIFARYGRTFNDEDLQDYFDSKDWYDPRYSPEYFDDNIADIVSDVEIENARFIKKYEDKLK